MKNILVTGAAGFIGANLTARLRVEGNWVRGVDLDEPSGPADADNDFVVGDLRDSTVAKEVMAGIDEVYSLAADMGGIGYIRSRDAQILRNNLLIDTNTLDAAVEAEVKRFLFTSSACVYPLSLQTDPSAHPIAEAADSPADPEGGYGWGKLTTEKLCAAYGRQLGIDTRVVRLFNIYGPHGAFQGRREKAPAALCRKVALSDEGGAIEVGVTAHKRERSATSTIALKVLCA